MKKRLYIGEGNGEKKLKDAWFDVYHSEISEEKLQFFLRKDKGTMFEIGRNNEKQTVYWISVGSSKEICKQGWADLWALLDDSIINWELID